MSAQNICQSCGMPLSNDPEKGGTNADGSKSEMYCSYCYQDGKFLYEGDDVYEFQDLCRRKMIESGQGKFMSWILTRAMSRLSRWKNS